MYNTLEEGSDTESEGHQDVWGLEPVHIWEEVASQLHVVVVVESVGAEHAVDHSEHEENGEGIPAFGDDAVAERDLDGPAAQEGEVFDVVLDQELEEDEFEGVGSEVFADLVVEGEEEKSVEEELDDQGQGDGEDEEVEDRIKKDIVVPGFSHELLVRVWVVFGEILHAPLDLLGVGLETHYFPLLLLNQADGLKHYFDDPIILLVMILVEP